jgi:3,4-dihydroxy 2-butanone 4-phosphate synthase/GTP cyclohydrolase II
VSVEARQGTTTGISAADRSATICKLIDPDAVPFDFVKPGHMFPIRAREGGVLVRSGQTEASLDLARLAGLFPAGVICEIMNEDGTMARMPQLKEFSKKFGIKIISVADLIRYRRAHEIFVKRSAVSKLPTILGILTLLRMKRNCQMPFILFCRKVKLTRRNLFWYGYIQSVSQVIFLGRADVTAANSFTGQWKR